MPRPPPAEVAGRRALGQRLDVSRPGPGGHEHPASGDVAPPAEVEVLAHEVDRRVEPPQVLEQISADEDAAAGYDEDVADAVVLALVELAPFGDGRGRTELVDVETDLQEPRRVMPVDELRTDDAGVEAHRLFHQHLHGVGIEGDIVVTQEVERRALDHAEHRVGRRAVPVVRRQPPDEGLRQDPPDPRAGILGAGGVDHEHGEAGIALRRQPGERLVEPAPGVVGDHHRDHRRNRPDVGGHSVGRDGAGQ